MADVTKTVEIALKVVGMDGKKIADIAKAFENIQKAVDKANTSVKGLQTSLDKLKTPASLTKVVNSLKEFNAIKIPNLNNIALGFEKLGNIKSPPDLRPFAESVKVFSNIKVPGINALATGLQKLADPKLLNLSGFAMRIGVVEKGLKRLEAINLKSLESVLTNIGKVNLAAATNSIKNLEKGMKQAGDTATQSGLKIRTFGDKVRTVFEFRLISQALLGLQAAISTGLTSIIEYDQALKDLQAITSATTLEVSQMGEKILEVASTTKFSASEVAEGMRVIGQAGFSASEAVETMQAVSDLATGTLSGMATTVDLVTTAMRVFKIDASESATVADVFANAVNKSKLTIDKLRTSMNYIGPIAQASGVSFTELSAAMGTLANSGLRASTIGTGLRRVFAELIDPSKKLKEAANNAGVALAELDPRSAGLSEVIANLGLVLNDAQVAFDVFGKRGAAAALALSDTDSGFQQMLITVGKSGTAAQMAAIQMEGLGVSFKNLKDKLGILAIAIGEAGISGAMKVLIDIGRYLIDMLTYLTNTTFGNLIIQATLVTASIFAISQALKLLAGTKVFVALVAGFKEVASFAILAGTSVSGLLLAIAPWAIAIAAATTAIVLFLSHLKKTKEASADAAKLSDTYSGLAKQVQDYNVKISGMAQNSTEVLTANKALRTSLLEIASEYSEVSQEASNAALSIDPLTGKIKEGSEALRIYNDRLKELALQKLADSAKFANEDYQKEVSNFVSRIEIYKDFDTALKNSVITYGKLKEYVANLNLAEGKLSGQQKELIEQFNYITEVSTKAFAQMQKSGEVDIDDTVENFSKLAEKIVGTGAVLEAMVDQFKELQKANESSFSNIIEKWASDGKDGVVEFIDEYKKLGGVFEDGNEAQIRSSELDKQSLVVKLQVLKDKQKAEEKAGLNIELTWKRYYTAERKLLKDAAKVRQATSENTSAQNIKLIIREGIALEKELKRLDVVYENNAKLRVKFQEDATRDYLAKRERLIQGEIIDPKAQEEAYKASLNERETLFAKHLDNLALQEAKGILTADQAQSQKVQSTIDFYKESYAVAVRYQNSIDKLENPEAYDKANKEVLAKEEAYYKARTKMLIEYNADVTEANTKLEKLDDKYQQETDKNTNKEIENKEKAKNKLLTIDEDYASKREAIADASAEKIKDIDDDIAENRREANSDILSLEQSTEEKIRNVRKRGMSDVAKDASDQEAANKYLREGRLLLAEADEEKDKEKLSRGTDLIKQGESLASGLKNQGEAVRLLKQALGSLKDARNVEAELKELDLIKKKNEEIAEAEAKQAANTAAYDQKVKTATTAIEAIITKENDRHVQEITNLEAEIKKWKEKLDLASKRVDTVVKDDPNSVKLENQRHDNEMENIQSEESAMMEKYNTARKELEDYGLSQEELDMDFDTFFSALTGSAATAKEKVDEIMDEEVVIDVDNEELEDTMTIFRWIDEFVKQGLDLLVKVVGYKDVQDLQKAFDELRDKTVTITTKYVSTGTAPQGFATGGKLPGYGGGDRNPVLAEDGEWFIRKEAVRKYGDGFMSMINNMSLPKFEFGGAVGRAATNPVSNPLANFGKVQIDMGKTSIPALVSKETFADLSTQLSNAKRFAV